tara:strand:+ start:3631 stop:3858 length:228 start_codon:yes stop_codon:yes gene_type:complete
MRVDEIKTVMKAIAGLTKTLKLIGIKRVTSMDITKDITNTGINTGLIVSGTVISRMATIMATKDANINSDFITII